MAWRRLDLREDDKGAITFAEIAETLTTLNVVCDRCGGHGRFSTARLVEKCGAGSTVQPLQDDLTRDCPEKIDPRYPFGKCAPMMPDLLLLPRNQSHKSGD